MTNSIAVILVDDHSVLLDSLEMYLSSRDINIKGKCKTQEAAIVAIRTMSNVDFVLLDINLNGTDGSELIEACLKQEIKVIVLSSYADLRIVKKCIKRGAKAYLLKDSPPEGILAAIRSIELGKIYIDPLIREKMVQFNFDPSDNDKDRERVIWSQLTQREKEILKLLSMEMTSEEIGKELFIARSTVDTHRKNLIEKLNVKNAVGLGVWAAQNGIV